MHPPSKRISQIEKRQPLVTSSSISVPETEEPSFFFGSENCEENPELTPACSASSLCQVIHVELVLCLVQAVCPRREPRFMVLPAYMCVFMLLYICVVVRA